MELKIFNFWSFTILQPFKNVTHKIHMGEVRHSPIVNSAAKNYS